MTTSAFAARRNASVRRALLCATTVLCSSVAVPALAQTAPPYRNLDANGVDLTLGNLVMNFEEGAVGSGPARLALRRRGASIAGSQWDRITFHRHKVSLGSVSITIQRDEISDTFVGSPLPGSYASAKGDGTVLYYQGAGQYLLQISDGSTIAFTDPLGGDEGDSNFCDSGGSPTDCDLVPTDFADPDGSHVAVDWNVANLGGFPAFYSWSLNSVSNNFGYSIVFAYGSGGRSGAQFLNGTSVVGSVSYTYASGTVNVSDMAGNVWQITDTSIKRPGESTPGFSIAGTPTAVTGATRDGVTTTYARTVSGSTGTMVVTDALSHATTIVSNLTLGRPTSVTDAYSHTTGYTYDTSGRLTRITQPEGNYTNYTYDARGNVTETRIVAKSGSGVADIVSTASYPSTCSNPFTCNQPTTTTDALSHTTSYSYDPTHGGVTKVTAPAPVTSGMQPETRYSYTSVGGIYQVTGISTCQTGAAPSCVGTSDEVKTTIGYDSAGNVTSVAKGAGDNSLTATTTATYTALGDVATMDGPLAGTADTTTFRYDAARRRVGVISADPDGAGALKRRAQKTTYDTAGRPTVDEVGYVNGTSDTEWAAFVSAQAVTTTYVNSRKATDVLTSGSTTYQVNQYSYDADGRLECTALRMNSATWGSLPSSACTSGTTGSAGPDRIGKTTYDYVGRATKTQSAYGTADQSDDTAGTYNDNGTLATLTDANGNKTTYEYDGDDRLVKTRYPLPTTAGTSSTTDYEQLVFGDNVNLTSRRLRGYAADSTQHIDYTYDALNRITLKDLRGTEPDVSYTYDLLNRPLSAATSTKTYSFTYDALDRNLTQTSPFGTTTTAYDLAGRRTFFGWQDGFYVTYDHLVTGETTAIRENGAASGIGVLATFGYDDLGRRTSVTRGNGTTVTYTPDAISRLSSLVQDLSGTSNDLTLGFSYNPASQIASTTRSNDSYAWGGAANRNDASAVNGLNQITTVGAGSLGYDVRGNLNSSGSNSYTYSSENLLLTGPSSATLYYDPLMRLYQESGGSIATTLFQYDGQAMIGEYDSTGVLQKRYVHGPGSDEPLVEYDRSGSSFVRAWHHADERGSVVAQSNDSGVSTATNAYDEYGVPGASNVGRFGYTGQTWLPSVGLWYYKARMYSSRLGRFMQTDPIGYGDGMNWHGYVAGDPINHQDGSGLYCQRVTTTTYAYRNKDGTYGPILSQDSHLEGDTCSPSLGNGSPSAPAGSGSNSPKPEIKKITCSTRLPNGKTVGDYVRQARAELQSSYDSSIAAMQYGSEGDPLSAALGTFFGIVMPGGQIDFKNNFAGKAPRELLGNAGNFAYYAIGAGYIPTTALDLGAGGYGLYGVAKGTFPSTFLTGRFYSDDSARRQREPGLAAGGC